MAAVGARQAQLRESTRERAHQEVEQRRCSSSQGRLCCIIHNHILAFIRRRSWVGQQMAEDGESILIRVASKKWTTPRSGACVCQMHRLPCFPARLQAKEYQGLEPHRPTVSGRRARCHSMTLRRPLSQYLQLHKRPYHQPRPLPQSPRPLRRQCRPLLPELRCLHLLFSKEEFRRKQLSDLLGTAGLAVAHTLPRLRLRRQCLCSRV